MEEKCYNSSKKTFHNDILSKTEWKFKLKKNTFENDTLLDTGVTVHVT